MALKKLTFDEALNTAKDDAFFNWYLTNKTNGIFYDLGDRCEATSANGKITFKDGFVSIYGRRVFIESGTSVEVSLNGSRKGYVILRIDTVNNTATLTTKEGTSSNYPSLTQTNLLNADGKFELPMVGYSKTTTSLTLDKAVVTYIRTNKSSVDSVNSSLSTRITNEVSTLNKTIESKQHGLAVKSISAWSRSGNVVKFDVSDVIDKPGVIILFAFNSNLFAVSLDLLKGTTALSFYYMFADSTVQGTVERDGDYVIIDGGTYCSSLKRIYCYY